MFHQSSFDSGFIDLKITNILTATTSLGEVFIMQKIYDGKTSKE